MRIFLFFSLFFSFFLIALLFFQLINFSNEAAKKDDSSFEEKLSNEDIIKDLPDNLTIQLNFRNSSSEDSYIIRRANVTKGNSASDILLFIDMKYYSRFKKKDFCDVIKEAEKDNDIDIKVNSTIINFASDSIKLLKYRDCFQIY